MRNLVTAMTERDRCERWFVRRGLPHLIDDYTATDDIFTRMAPFLAGVVFSSSSSPSVTGGRAGLRRSPSSEASLRSSVVWCS